MVVQKCKFIWAVPYEIGSSGICAYEVSDQLMHLPNFITTFAFFLWLAKGPIDILTERWRLWTDCADAPSDFRLYWPHVSENISKDAAHIVPNTPSVSWHDGRLHSSPGLDPFENYMYIVLLTSQAKLAILNTSGMLIDVGFNQPIILILPIRPVLEGALTSAVCA